MSAPDALAASLLIILAIAFGVVLSILVCLAKNAGKKDELAELLEDRDKAKPSASPNKIDKKGEGDWEKDADWWKTPES